MHSPGISTVSPHPLVNGTKATNKDVESKMSEMFSQIEQVDIDFKRFFGVKPTRVDRRFTLKLTEQMYLPKVNNSRHR